MRLPKFKFLQFEQASGWLPPARLSHWILWASTLFFLIALVWAKFATLDVVTLAEGKVIPSRQIQIIQNLEGGIVEKILVKEGDMVQAGEVLIQMDETVFASSYRSTQLKVISLQAKIYRLTAEIKGETFKGSQWFLREHPSVIGSEKSLYDARKQELKTQAAELENQLAQKKQELLEALSRQKQLARSYALVSKELKLTKPLVKEGAVSKVEVIRLERQVSDLKGELDTNKISMPRLQSAIKEANSKLKNMHARFRTKTFDELAKTKAELSGLRETIKAYKDRLTRTAIRSPLKGIVKQIYVNTITGVVKPGMDLIELVPLDDTLLIEARVRPADIAFLRPGLPALVKLTAYDFSVYGGLKATLEHISADTIKTDEGESFYEIKVRTKKNYLGSEKLPLPIIPGMHATVDIITGHRTVLNYLLNPITKLKNSALKER